jgi:dGTPase
MNTLREFLFERVYHSGLVEREADKARSVVRSLYQYFSRYEEKLPGDCASQDQPVARKATDYIAGMTDQYALQAAREAGLI